jgi:perosamine synthetase
MDQVIPVYKPSLDGNEKKYLNECIETTWISSRGKFIDRFEHDFARYLGVDYATTTSNGTTALHLALLALGVGDRDEVIVPTLTYIASVNSIGYTGATPVFVDSEKKTWNMDIEDIKRKITKNTKAILVVHLYGHPCNMTEIATVAADNNLFVLEDCAEAIGAKVDNKYVGTFGDVSTFSFFGNKTITTGEGGMVVTNDNSLMQKVIKLKNQGINPRREYWHDVVGYNYRMTNMSAAIGCAQLERIDEIIAKKRHIAQCYKKEISTLDIVCQNEMKGYVHSYWMFSVLFSNQEVRKRVREGLMQNSIETRPLFSPAHKMDIYRDGSDIFPVAEDLGSRGINLPSYPELPDKSIKNIVSIIASYL